MKKLLAPSILSANFAYLAEEVKKVESSGADWLHVDVMDGHFVPNLSFGPQVVHSLRPITKLEIDCHLMVSDPGRWIDLFLKAGADGVTFHLEACSDPKLLLQKIKASGRRAGLSLNPKTPIHKLEPFLQDLDLILLMCVEPGFGGQGFLESSYERLAELKKLQSKSDFLIEVDGGVKETHVVPLCKQGADILVIGSGIFHSENPQTATRQFKSLMSA